MRKFTLFLMSLFLAVGAMAVDDPAVMDVNTSKVYTIQFANANSTNTLKANAFVYCDNGDVYYDVEYIAEHATNANYQFKFELAGTDSQGRNLYYIASVGADGFYAYNENTTNAGGAAGSVGLTSDATTKTDKGVWYVFDSGNVQYIVPAWKNNGSFTRGGCCWNRWSSSNNNLGMWGRGTSDPNFAGDNQLLIVEVDTPEPEPEPELPETELAEGKLYRLVASDNGQLSNLCLQITDYAQNRTTSGALQYKTINEELDEQLFFLEAVDANANQYYLKNTKDGVDYYLYADAWNYFPKTENKTVVTIELQDDGAFTIYQNSGTHINGPMHGYLGNHDNTKADGVNVFDNHNNTNHWFFVHVGDIEVPEEPVFSYETLDKPTFTSGGNTTQVAMIELNGTNIPGFTYTQGTTTRFDMPQQVEAGKTYKLDLTYDVAWGDLAIFQIDKEGEEKKYGYYKCEWPDIYLESNTSDICKELGIGSFDDLKVKDFGQDYLTFPYQITINENLQPGDITVVRVMVAKHAPAHNQKNIPEGGCLDLVFEVAAPSHTLNVSNAGWATLMLGYNTVIPSTVKAYTVSEINNGYVTLTQVQGILPAQAPVLIEAAAGEHYFEKTNEAGSDLGNNWLEGTLTDAVIQKTEGWSYYVLGVVDDEVGFYNAKLGADDTQFKNGANKAYLLVQGKSSIASYSFRFGEGTTGISEVKGENGEVKAIFDLTGRKVETISAPGIYIVNGVKRVVR